MLAWLVDNANFVYLILGLVILGLGVSAWLNPRVRTLAGIAAVAALIALVWLLTVLVPTDRSQIQANLWAMARAVQDKKANDLSKHLARDFRYQGSGREELARLVTQASERFKVNHINLWEFEVKSLADDKAKIGFRCVAHSADGGAFTAICVADFVKEGEAWKLQRIRFFNPVANTDQEIALPIG